ncbi:MAG TPA: hypothetical protein VGK97_04580 [Spongiibacteraceae bacterium]|jgi:hypothetical protein
MNSRGRSPEDRVEELSFEDESPPPRAGDPRIEPGRRDPEISAERAHHAGMTAGELNLDVTSDDLSPETLFDEDAVDNDEFVVADKDLSIVDENEIGGGNGLDEAELAIKTGRPD